MLFILLMGAANMHAAVATLNFPAGLKPVVGVNPVTVGTTADNYAEYTVVWTTASGTSVSGPFSASTAYKATITVTPTSGNSLQIPAPGSVNVGGVSMGIDAIIQWNGATGGEFTLLFPATDTKVVYYGGNALSATIPVANGNTIVALSGTGIAGPTYGFTKASATTARGWQKEGANGWEPVSTGDLIAAGTVYRAFYTLTAYSDATVAYTFFEADKDNFKVTPLPTGTTLPAGTEITLEVDPTKDFKEAKLYIEFPATDPLPSKDITALIAKPVTGATMQTTFSPDQFEAPAGLTWQGESSPGSWGTPALSYFVAGGKYRAIFFVTGVKPGYSPIGFTTDYFTYNGADVTTNIGTGEVIVTFPATDKTMNFGDGLAAPYSTPAEWKALLLAATPKAGALAKQASDITLTHKDFTITGVEWKADEGGGLDDADKFKINSTYSAFLTIKPKSGYTAVGSDLTNTFSIEGYTAKNIEITPGGDLIVQVGIGDYPKTERLPTDVNVFSPAASAAVPVLGGNVSISLTSLPTTYNVSGVSWKDDQGQPVAVGTKFEGGIEYVLSMDIEVKDPSVTLYGLDPNFYKVTGAEEVTFTEDPANPRKGTLEITYPATKIQIVPSLKLTQPVAGSLPGPISVDGGCTIIDIEWDPVPSYDDKFDAGTIYKAIITLEEENADYYTFGSLTISDIKADLGEVVAYDPSTKKVTVELPSTEQLVRISSTPGEPLDLAPTAGQKAPGEVSGTGYTSTEIKWTYVNDLGQTITHDNDIPFEVNVVYTAEVTLTPTPGYTTYGLSEKFANDLRPLWVIRTNIDGQPSIAEAVTAGGDMHNILTIKYRPTPAAANLVTQKNVLTFETPVAGAIHDLTTLVTWSISPIAENQVDKVTTNGSIDGWMPIDDRNNNQFMADSVYFMRVAIAAKAGFTLKGIDENFFEVDGAIRVTNPASTSDTLLLTVYAKTGKLITKRELLIDAPIAGAPAPIKLLATDELQEATIVWSPTIVNSKFAANTAYTATIDISAKSNYTLYGIDDHFFTVDVADAVSNDPIDDDTPTSTVIIDFATTKKTVGHRTIVLPNPVAGEVAPTTISDLGTPEQFTGTVTWEPAIPADGKYLAGTQYTATFNLEPAEGYTFATLPKNVFSINTTLMTHDAGVSEFVCGYPETDPLVGNNAIVNVDWVPGIDKPIPTTPTATSIGIMNGGVIDIAWDPAPESGAKFTQGVEYVVKGKVTANPTHTLYGLTEDYFTVVDGTGTEIEGATASYNVTNSILTIRFASLTRKVEIKDEDGKRLDVAPTEGQAAPGTVTGEGYTGSIVWTYTNDYGQKVTLPTGAPFKLHVIYTATITLTADADYTLDGLTISDLKAIKLDINGQETATSVILTDGNILTVVYKSTPSTSNLVSQKKTVKLITGATLPLAGKAYASKADIPTLLGVSQVDYVGSLSNLKWVPDEPIAGSRFQAETEYTIKVAVAAKPGFTLKGIEEDFFEVEGATWVTHPEYNSSDTIVLTVVVKTGKLITENELAIATPEAGVPIYTKLSATDELQAVDNIDWYTVSATNAETAYTGTRFNVNTKYRAKFSVKANTSEYTLYGLSKDFFTVESATVTNTAVNGTGASSVTVTFAVTAKTIEITHRNLELPQLFAGEIAPTVIFDTVDPDPQFEGTISWDEELSPDGRFLAGKTYTATFTLWGINGYTFYRIPSNTITVNGSATTIHDTGTAGENKVIYSYTTKSLPNKRVTVNDGFNPALLDVFHPGNAFTVGGATVVGNKFSWSPNLEDTDEFVQGVAYEVSGKLTSTSRTFYGLTEDYFTVQDKNGVEIEGAVASYNVADSILTIRFAQLPSLITILNIPEITQPIEGNERITRVETEEYTADITWYVVRIDGNDDEVEELFSGATFQVGNIYRAVITVTPKKPDYTLYGLKKDAFRIDGKLRAQNNAVTTDASFVVATITFDRAWGTGIDYPQASELTVVSINGALRIGGLTVGESVSVYTLQGILVSRKVAISTEQEVQLPAGIYIVATGEKRVKALNK
jgi:hypothetical protein